MDKRIIPILIFAAGLVAGAAGFYSLQGGNSVSADEAGKIAIDFINGNIEEGVTASLVEASAVGSLFKIHLRIAETDYESYLTKDGKFLFPSGINLQERQQASEEPEPASFDSLKGFAECLTEAGAKFYGAFWCGHCKNQKEMFGDAAEFLPYIECSAEDGTTQLDACKDNGITSYPTWEFSDGSRESGELSFEKLAEKTGCSLPQ